MFACPEQNPATRLLPQGDEWVLLEPFWFTWVGQGETIHRHIPAGFVTDGASIPRFYRWRFSPTGKGFRAAVAHDWLYREAVVPRGVCDQVFRDGLAFCGENGWNQRVIHAALRIGGWTSYGKNAIEILDFA